MRKRDEPARVGVVLYNGLELLDAGPERTASSRSLRAFCRRSRGSRSRTRSAQSPSPAGPWQPPDVLRDRRPLTLGVGRRARSPARHLIETTAPSPLCVRGTGRAA